MAAASLVESETAKALSSFYHAQTNMNDFSDVGGRAAMTGLGYPAPKLTGAALNNGQVAPTSW